MHYEKLTIVAGLLTSSSVCSVSRYFQYCKAQNSGRNLFDLHWAQVFNAEESQT